MRIAAISDQGYTYGTMPDGTDIQCPPGQPFDAALMNCSGAPCLPMIPELDAAGHVVYSLPSGPLAPGQAICPPPGETDYTVLTPGEVSAGKSTIYIMAGAALLLLLVAKR